MAFPPKPNDEALRELLTELGLNINQVLQWPRVERRHGRLVMDYLTQDGNVGSIEVTTNEAVRYLNALRPQ